MAPEMIVDVSYAPPQVHGIVNVTLHREYHLGIVLFSPKGSSNSIMSKAYVGITLSGTINPNRGYAKRI
jgi:hypothetical protein